MDTLGDLLGESFGLLHHEQDSDLLLVRRIPIPHQQPLDG